MNICFITPIKNRLLLLILLTVLSGTRAVYAAAPTITSFAPLSGPFNTEVTITGTGFSSTASVLFGTIKAVVTSSTSTQLTVEVPKGVAHERITVQVNGLSAISNQYFLLTSTYDCALTQYSFQDKVDFTAGANPNHVAAGDIDNDGRTDLVVANLLGSSVTIYQNNSAPNSIESGSFNTSTIAIVGGMAVSYVLLQDLDGDQKPELIVAIASSTVIYIYPNNSTLGNIVWGGQETVSLGNSAKKITIADMDLDGQPDIIAANHNKQFISVLRNISTPQTKFSFAAPVTFNVSSNPDAITTGDLNKDNLPEIIVTIPTTGEVIIFTNRGSLNGFNNLSFFPTNVLSTDGIGAYDVKVEDFNGDNLLDIAVANSGVNAATRSIAIFKNILPSGTRTTPSPLFAESVNYAVPEQVMGLAIADFNGDSKPDIAVSVYGNNTLALYSNTVSGTAIDATSFSLSAFYPTEMQPVALCTADFDKDGKTDIATASAGGGMSIIKRADQFRPEASMIFSTNDQQVTTCPSTEVSLKLGLSGVAPWTIKYIPDGSYALSQTITGITDPAYEFTVAPEKTTSYQTIYVSDAQKCSSFKIYPNYNLVKIISTPALKPNTIPHAPLGSPYNQTLTLEPTAVPLSWSISSGLPTGLIFTNGVISDTPTVRNTYSFTVTAAFTDCDAIRQYHMLCTDFSTTWNGTSWSNGVPTSSKDAIIDGNYNTAVNGVFSCFHLAVNESDTLFIKGSSTITASGNAINNGAIYKDCSAALAITGTFAGQAIKTLQPQILPAFLSNGLVNLPYSQALRVSIGESPTYTFAGTLPTGLSLTNGIISGTPNKTGRYDFSIHSTENGGLCEASGNFSIIIETVDPALKFPANGITKYTGTASFSYIPTTKSNGAISYSIEPANGCATVDANGNISISCGEPIKQYTITAIQDADYIYKADTATTILTIEKSKPQLRFAKTGYVLGSTTGNTIQYITNSTGTVSVFQVNNSNVAVVNMAGAVVPIAAGTFDILLKIAETPNFLPIDTVIAMGVYSNYVPPVAVPIKVELEMGQDSTFNILTSAQGITGAIQAALTDIDTENSGVQYRFYSTALGNFLLDNNGNLTVKPFSGFIGEVNVGYVLTDENGTTSDVYYITVQVDPPYVIPDLKANDVMTPNNDGLNDNFVIGYTDITKANSLIILDEAGSTIYTATNYQNDWTGTTNKGDTLEPGVYFYAFTETYSGRTLNGYIQIIK